MEENYNTDDFLAKWASGELSNAEKEQFKNTKDYSLYQAILEGTDLLDVPEYNNDRMFDQVEQKISEKGKVVPLIPKWAYGVAASIAVLLCSYLYFTYQSTTYTTDYGEQLAIQLPDESEVSLNARSSITYKKQDWKKEKRYLSLSGEAFFKVKKGSDFVVNTDQGTVSVLGTQFSVNSTSDIFEVICTEGRVKVEINTATEVLTKGEAVRWIDNTLERFNQKMTSPSWLNNESSFTNAPLYQVITALENQYQVTIHSASIRKDARFTGSFTHTDLTIALRTVFESMDIIFTFTNESVIELSNP